MDLELEPSSHLTSGRAPFNTSEHFPSESTSPRWARGQPYSIHKYARCKKRKKGKKKKNTSTQSVAVQKKKSLISIQFCDRHEPVQALSARRERERDTHTERVREEGRRERSSLIPANPIWPLRLSNR